MLTEQYTEYRVLNPVHLAIHKPKTNYRGKRNKGVLLTSQFGRTVEDPEKLFAIQSELFDSLKHYYDSSGDFLSRLTRNGTYQATSEAHRQFFSSLQEGDGPVKTSEPEKDLDFVKNDIREVFVKEPIRISLCKRICRPNAYYFSWDFCRRICRIKDEYLSNDNGMEIGLGVLPKVGWRTVGDRWEVLSFGKGLDHFWSLEFIQELWSSEDVQTCPMSWNSIVCNFR